MNHNYHRSHSFRTQRAFCPWLPGRWWGFQTGGKCQTVWWRQWQEVLCYSGSSACTACVLWVGCGGTNINTINGRNALRLCVCALDNNKCLKVLVVKLGRTHLFKNKMWEKCKSSIGCFPCSGLSHNPQNLQVWSTYLYIPNYTFPPGGV